MADYQRAKELFLRARDLLPRERDAWLAEACGGDAALCAHYRVVELLGAGGIADSLAHAHERGIVHRDYPPNATRAVVVRNGMRGSARRQDATASVDPFPSCPRR